MKYLVLFFMVVFASCSTKNPQKKLLSKVESAYFTTRAADEFERGYQLDIEIRRLNPEATINKIIYKKSYAQNYNLEKKGNSSLVSTYIPITSRKVRGFRQSFIDKEDGLILEFDGKEYFIPVKFEVKRSKRANSF